MQDQSKNTECVKFFQNGLITDGTQPDSCGKFSFAKRSLETCAKSSQQLKYMNTLRSIEMFQTQTWLVFPLYFIHVISRENIFLYSMENKSI